MSRNQTIRFTADQELAAAILVAASFRKFKHNTTNYLRTIVTERLIEDGFLQEEQTSNKQEQEVAEESTEITPIEDIPAVEEPKTDETDDTEDLFG